MRWLRREEFFKVFAFVFFAVTYYLFLIGWAFSPSQYPAKFIPEENLTLHCSRFEGF